VSRHHLGGLPAPLLLLVILGLVAYVVSAGSALSDRRIEIGFTLSAGLIAVALSRGWARRPEGLPPMAAALLLTGLVYGAATGGVWEARSAERGAVYPTIADDLAAALDAPLPVVSAGDRGRWLHLGFALSRRIGRTVQARPPDHGDYYLVTRSTRPPRWAEAPLAESGGFSLWRFDRTERVRRYGEPGGSSGGAAPAVSVSGRSASSAQPPPSAL